MQLPVHLDGDGGALTDPVQLPFYCVCFDSYHLPRVTYSGFRYT